MNIHRGGWAERRLKYSSKTSERTMGAIQNLAILSFVKRLSTFGVCKLYKRKFGFFRISLVELERFNCSRGESEHTYSEFF